MKTTAAKPTKTRTAKPKANGHDTATSICVVLDRSGSMESIRAATIAGFNLFLAEQAKLPGASFSMTQFDSQSIDVLYLDRPVAEVIPLSEDTYQPRASTPLYDAVGQTLRALEARQPAGKVVFVIVSDGEENASHEFGYKDVFDLIAEKRKLGWEFAFMGANLDAYATGAGLGMARQSSYQFAPTLEGTQAAYRALSHQTSSYRSGMTASLDLASEPGQAPRPGDTASPAGLTWQQAAKAAKTAKVAVTPLELHRS
jgi:Mg-chelatase subunit ChlD